MGKQSGQGKGVLGTEAGRFRWSESVLWFVSVLAVGGVVGWVSALVERRFAPWLLFPCFVGLVAGGLLVCWARWAGVGNRWVLLAGTGVAALVIVLGQHGWSYQSVRIRFERQLERVGRQGSVGAAMVEGGDFFPRGIWQFLRWEANRGRPLPFGLVARGWLAWASWAADGVLLAGAAVGVMAVAAWQPYCNSCHSWYRTLRAGRVSGQAWERLRRVAGDVPVVADRLEYRLVGCRGGCGRTAWVIGWKDARRRQRRVCWLDPIQRRQLWELLDEAAEANG